MSNYLFQSERLGFRKYTEADVPLIIAMNQDEEVMRFFPFCPSPEDTKAFMERMNKTCDEKGYCYFAVDRLDTNQLIGFIGLLDQSYEAPFTPCTDIGWRLMKEHWHKGFATEGALACLEYGFHRCGLKEVISTAPSINIPSLSVMQKIGMTKVGEFEHPRLSDYPHIRTCEYYSIKKSE